MFGLGSFDASTSAGTAAAVAAPDAVKTVRAWVRIGAGPGL